MITVSNLIYEYPNKRVLNDVSFEIQSGSVTALVGPNGAGKTTLLRCLSGLNPLYAGEIHVDGIDVTESPREVHRRLGYLSDFFGVYNSLTVQQCLDYNARIQRIDHHLLEEKILLAANRVGITPHLNTAAGELSRGLRQRLGIAQAIIHEPKVLLLDEPASGLDPEARFQLSELILTLRDQGTTIIVSSHIISELEDYCSDMMMIREGRLVSHMASDTLNQNKQTQSLLITLTEDAKAYHTILSSLTALQDIQIDGPRVHSTLQGDSGTCHEIIKTLIQNNVPVCGVTTHKKRLQDIYMDHRTNEDSNDVE